MVWSGSEEKVRNFPACSQQRTSSRHRKCLHHLSFLSRSRSGIFRETLKAYILLDRSTLMGLITPSLTAHSFKLCLAARLTHCPTPRKSQERSFYLHTNRRCRHDGTINTYGRANGATLKRIPFPKDHYRNTCVHSAMWPWQVHHGKLGLVLAGITRVGFSKFYNSGESGTRVVDDALLSCGTRTMRRNRLEEYHVVILNFNGLALMLQVKRNKIFVVQ